MILGIERHINELKKHQTINYKIYNYSKQKKKQPTTNTQNFKCLLFQEEKNVMTRHSIVLNDLMIHTWLHVKSEEDSLCHREVL